MKQVFSNIHAYENKLNIKISRRVNNQLTQQKINHFFFSLHHEILKPNMIFAESTKVVKLFQYQMLILYIFFLVSSFSFFYRSSFTNILTPLKANCKYVWLVVIFNLYIFFSILKQLVFYTIFLNRTMA